MHPLFTTTKRTVANVKNARPENATYDFRSGMWGGPDGPLCDDQQQIPQSKKNDLETGEDQKGQ